MAVCTFCRESFASDAEVVAHAPECPARAWWLANFAGECPREAAAPSGLSACRWCGSLFEPEELERHGTECGQRRWLELNFAGGPKPVTTRPPPLRLPAPVKVREPGLLERVKSAIRPRDVRAERLEVVVGRANAIRDLETYATVHRGTAPLLDLPAAAAGWPLLLGTADTLLNAADALEQLHDELHRRAPMTLQRQLEDLEARGEVTGERVARLHDDLAACDVLEQRIDADRSRLAQLADRLEQLAKKIGGGATVSAPAAPAPSGGVPPAVSAPAAPAAPDPDVTPDHRARRAADSRSVLDPREVRSLAEEARPAASLPFARTAKIGPYQIVGLLGAGGMGVVYEARSPSGQRVALKTVRIGSDESRGDQLLRRFRRECRILARVQHPSCVRLLDVGQANREQFLVLELVDGLPLSEVIRKRKLTREEAGRLAIEVGAALAYLHESGIVHRDLKPANVLLRQDGTVVIADFGISRLSEATEITQEGVVLGTPGYVAPEVVLGYPSTYASDQWALGRLLFSAVAAGPELGSEASFRSRLRAGTTVDFAGFPSSPDWRRTRDLIERMLAPEPERRFPSLDEVVARFRSLAGAP